MTIEQAIAQLENMKMLKGYSNTTVNGEPLVNIIDQIIALLNDQDITIRALLGEYGDSCDVNGCETGANQ